MANFKTSIKATNYELHSDIENYIDRQIAKFQKVLPKDKEVILDVEIGKLNKHHNLGHIFRAEFNLVSEGKLFRAEQTEEKINAAIDLAADDMVRQIRKTTEKRTDLIRRGAKKVKGWLRLN